MQIEVQRECIGNLRSHAGINTSYVARCQRSNEASNELTDEQINAIDGDFIFCMHD